jgi:2-methylcitrate dehydratase
VGQKGEIMDGLTRQIAEFAAQARYGDLPEEVIQTARVRIVDAIGCALGGRGGPTLAAAEQLITPVAAGGAALTGWQLGRAEADLPLDLAAFLNTSMIRYLDFNDWFPGGHPSDTVGGLIALAGARGATGRGLITATVVSYEVFAWLTVATDFRKRGFDQGFAMGIATAAAIGNLLGLDAPAIGAAVGILAASGVPLRASRSGQLSMWKGCATAYAVRNAAFTTQLAAAGMTGPPAAFEGRNGLWDLVTGEFTLEPFGSAAADYQITRTSLKYWPVGSHLQGAVWAGLRLRELTDVAAIKSLAVGTYWEAWRDTGSEPDKWDPMTRETADHSIPYALAWALEHGRIDQRAFEPGAYRDPAMLQSMGRISVAVDDEAKAAFPDHPTWRVQAVAGGGERIDVEVVNAAGHPDNPMTDQQVRDKFRGLAEPVTGGRARADAIFDAWWAITAEGAPIPMAETVLTGG